MAFKIVYDDAGAFEDFGEDASYRFNAAGLLVVDSGDIRRTYAPRGWVYIEQRLNQRDDTPAVEGVRLA